MGLHGCPLPDPDALEPGVEQPRAQLTWQFVRQARACEVAGSPLYAMILRAAAQDLQAGGLTWELTREHVAPGRGNAIALRLMAALHRLVLTDQAPALRDVVGAREVDRAADNLWADVHATMEEHRDSLPALVALGCQTNEPGRSAALILGVLAVADHTGLPVAIHEMGTAAGLNLRLDHFRYGGDGATFGPADSPVNLEGYWVDLPRRPAGPLEVVERRGVDRTPIDPATEAGRLALTSSVWIDQHDRLDRLDGAIDLASRHPATIETGDAATWVEDVVRPVGGQVVVLMHSVVEEYLSDEERARIDAAIRRAGAAATPNAPVARARLEPVSAVRRHGLRVQCWPGDAEELLVTSAALGSDVRRPTSAELSG